MRLPPLLGAALLLAPFTSLHADTFGTTGNEFTIDFVTIGHPGNGDDAGAGGGLYSSPFGGVGYAFRIGVYEISQAQFLKASNSGLADVASSAWTGNQPTAMSWYEAAAFVNWMNTSTGHQAAYNLTYSGGWSMTLWSSGDAWQADGENRYRHKDAYYFLPSEDEWYKAAFHQNDGVTANYWDYALGSNSIPTPAASGTTPGTAVYNSFTAPADVDQSGGLSSYGTMGQNGNLWEWMESASDGSNDSTTEHRALRGVCWDNPEFYARSSFSNTAGPTLDDTPFGFRVASVVPEPGSLGLLLFGTGLLLQRRRG